MGIDAGSWASETAMWGSQTKGSLLCRQRSGGPAEAAAGGAAAGSQAAAGRRVGQDSSSPDSGACCWQLETMLGLESTGQASTGIRIEGGW